VGLKRLEQIIEGVDKLVVTQPVVDGAALLASTEQVEVQELTQVCRDRPFSSSSMKRPAVASGLSLLCHVGVCLCVSRHLPSVEAGSHTADILFPY
jgi:hypothetical protein